MRPKPLYGEACNRCGLCCLLSQCRVSVLLLGPQPGPCRALREDGLGGYYCGLTTTDRLSQVERDAVVVAIGSGLGCDMAGEDPADLRARELAIPRMRAGSRRNDRELHAPGRRVLRAWGLAPG